MGDTPGGVCDYCNADEGRCWDDCPTVKIKQQADEIERLREQERKMTNHALDRMEEIERLREVLHEIYRKCDNDRIMWMIDAALQKKEID